MNECAKANSGSQQTPFLDIKYRKVESYSYETTIRRILRYSSETWGISEKVKMAHRAFERKRLRRIYMPVQEFHSG
jgi:hypothetical protein